MKEAHGFYLFELRRVSVLVSRPVKSPLKVQNGVREADSPIRKVSKRSRQILDSDSDNDEEAAPVVKEQAAAAAAKGQGDKEAPGKREKVKDTSTVLVQFICNHKIQQTNWIYFVSLTGCHRVNEQSKYSLNKVRYDSKR